MAIPNLSDEQMRTALKALEQALYNHDQWAEALYGALICRLQPDQRDMSGEAHRLCRFGQWYYSSGMVELERHPGFKEIGIEHERMHQYAAGLLRATADGTPISIHDYERFAEQLCARGITRTSNNPTGDLAEYLFCRTFGWKQVDNSKANIDAVDSAGLRYQIKGRRIKRIGAFYTIEAEIRGLPAAERRAVRQHKTAPLIAASIAGCSKPRPRP